MNICILSRFFDLRNAGIGRYSMELLQRLKANHNEINTVSQDGGIPLGEGSVKYLAYTALEIAFKIPKSEIYHACSPIETVHVPKPLTVFFHDLIPMLYLRDTETHYARGDLIGFRRWFGSNYFKMTCSIAIRKANAMIAQSEQTKQELIHEFGVDKDDVKVIRHGIRPDLEPRPKTNDGFRIGTISYLDPRKRIDILIKAFLNADIEGELLIAGKGIEYARLKALAGDDSRIKFLGFVPDEKLVDFYNSLDVLAFPTKVEGYGFPAVEGMACKKPVVTLLDSIIPSDVKDRTIVVDNLEEWLRNPDFSGINLDKNYKFAKYHRWETCAKEHIEVFQKVLEGVRE